MLMPNRPRFLALLVVGAALLFVVGAGIALGVKPGPRLAQEQQTQARKQVKSPEQKEPPPKQYEFPYGGRELLPKHRFVALYGTPGTPKLGVLGEKDASGSIQAAKDLAAQYQPFSTEKVWPTLEIITTIASASPTSNGDYSNELDIEALKLWVDAAKEAGVYVVLDLQPGRADFLTQAKMYETLLKEPHVGLALDPEWRLKPDQVHMKQIGSVDAAEVNDTAVWLSDLTKQYKLPQKMFLLHQFRLSMIANRPQLDTSHKELAYVIQMDGNGAQPTKLSTWQSIIADPPASVYFGWKNFYDEDHPVLTPEQTMGLQPQPWYISYQ
jgi:hypothetical protein